MSVVVEDTELHELLERGLSKARGTTVSLHRVDRRPLDAATSYALELLHVQLDTGERVDVLLKDFGTSRLPKDDVAARAERELTAYRRLLDRSRSGTPQFYAVAYRPIRLLLEYVDGTPLASHGTGPWMETAAWLGAFHVAMAGRGDELEACRPLIRHGVAFFLERERAARAAVTAFGPTATRRLGSLLDGYERLVAAMVDQPRTLVHGSFRPQNVVVSRARDGAVRICPVDWELAGLGSPLYDLAFLAEGFDGEDLDRLVATYLRAAGVPGPAGPELTFVVDCFRLHKVVKSVGDAVALAFRPATVDKLLGMGEALRERLA